MCHITNLDKKLPQVHKHNRYKYIQVHTESTASRTYSNCYFANFKQDKLCYIRIRRSKIPNCSTNASFNFKSVVQVIYTWCRSWRERTTEWLHDRLTVGQAIPSTSSSITLLCQTGLGVWKLNNSKVSKPLSLAAQLSSAQGGGISSWSRWFEWGGWSLAKDATGPCGVWF